MTKIIAALVATATMAFAGSAVEEVYVAPVVDNSGFYAGVAYSFGTGENQLVGPITLTDSIDVDSVALQVGYNVNEYLAVEGRYHVGIETDAVNAGTDSAVLFVKPQLPLNKDLTVYGLAGYAWNTSYTDVTADVDFDGFAYGVGAKYAATENVEVFVDYTSLYSDSIDYGRVTADTDLYTVNVGVSYRF